jgi:hypothetical protein
VDRHRFDADPNSTFPFWWRSGSGSYSKLFTWWKIRFFYVYSMHCQFIFLVFVTAVIFHCIRSQIPIKTSADSQHFFSVFSQFKLFYYFIIKERQQFHKVAKKLINTFQNYFRIPYFSLPLARGSSEPIQGEIKPLDKSSTLSYVFYSALFPIFNMFV